MTTKRWRPGYGPRTLFHSGTTWWTFKSEHPREERLVELTRDYEDERGDLIPPEAVAPERDEDHLSPSPS